MARGAARSDADEQRSYGGFLAHDERRTRTGEFLHLPHTAWNRGEYDFEGVHHRGAGGRLRRPPLTRPPVFFGGSSEAALPIAARHADTCLTRGEPRPPGGRVGPVAQLLRRARSTRSRVASEKRPGPGPRRRRSAWTPLSAPPPP
ncbi:LLM class flavin-dependent oxidoreductase [Streptomyces sp. NPDC018972]|uniref:LLM class flavin-dependent oxidoreductase n=1 Tax=Streptomyces sp. NPDC018972 TaxID=3365060 RepID=UPI0037B141C9